MQIKLNCGLPGLNNPLRDTRYLFLWTGVILGTYFLGALGFIAMLHWYTAYPAFALAIIGLMLMEYRYDRMSMNKYKASQKEAGNPEDINRFVELVREAQQPGRNPIVQKILLPTDHADRDKELEVVAASASEPGRSSD